MKRDAFFDNLKAILIFLVVFCHGIEKCHEFWGGILTAIHCEILCFLMPTFIFVQGFFSKRIARDDKKRRIILNYIILYFVFQIIKMVIFEKKYIFSPQYGNWFLVACILWYAIIPLFDRMKWQYGIISAVLMALLWGTNPAKNNILGLSRVIVYFPYFLCGFYCSPELVEKIKSKKGRIVGALMLIPMLHFAYLYCQRVPYAMLQANTCYGDMKLGRIEGLYLRAIWFCICILMSFCFLALIPRRNVKLLDKIGTRTLAIYMFHMVLYAVLFQYFDYLQIYKIIPEQYLLVYLLAVSTIMTLLFSIKWFSDCINRIMKIRMDMFFNDSEELLDTQRN